MTVISWRRAWLAWPCSSCASAAGVRHVAPDHAHRRRAMPPAGGARTPRRALAGWWPVRREAPCRAATASKSRAAKRHWRAIDRTCGTAAGWPRRRSFGIAYARPSACSRSRATTGKWSRIPRAGRVSANSWFESGPRQAGDWRVRAMDRQGRRRHHRGTAAAPRLRVGRRAAHGAPVCGGRRLRGRVDQRQAGGRPRCFRPTSPTTTSACFTWRTTSPAC